MRRKNLSRVKHYFMQKPSFDKNLVNVKQQVHWRQDRMKSSVSELGHVTDLWRQLQTPGFQKCEINDGSFYNFVVNTAGLKDWSSYTL